MRDHHLFVKTKLLNSSCLHFNKTYLGGRYFNIQYTIYWITIKVKKVKASYIYSAVSSP